MPEISIITPNYNSEKYLAETAQSVLNQSFTDWEWIISDDASSDQSVKLLKQLNDQRIKIIESKEQKGAAIARNKALEQSKGRFITFLDSDDLWKDHFLEDSLNFLKNNNETLVYSSYERVDENLQPKLKDFEAIDFVNYQRILYNCPIPMLTAMYDSKKIGKTPIPIVDKREDHAMWIEILKKTPYARAIKEPLGIYRIRENSYSRNKFKLIKPQFDLYFYYLNLPLYKSIYYTLTWAINGIFKYQ